MSHKEFVPDYLEPGLRIVFIGFNPSLRSGETGHHFANPNNRFWKILFESGLSDRIYSPQEDRLLLELGFGLTNIVSRPTRSADEVSREEYARGRSELIIKLSLYRPAIACFVGKGVFQAYSGRRNIEWGLQANEIIPGIRDFVAPSSSGLVRMGLKQITGIYRELKDLIDYEGSTAL